MNDQKQPECIFCQIAARQLSAEIIFQDEIITAFKDNLPFAPVHLLVIPNRHISSINDIQPEDQDLLGYMLIKAKDLAIQSGIADEGYRLMINTGKNGGQTIFHLHLHIIGGTKLPAR